MALTEKTKRFLGLSLALAKCEFKLKNEGSYLGVLWYLLNPLIYFVLLYFLFRDRLGGDVPLYSMYLLIGVVIFNLFQDITLESTRAIRDYSGIIKSINFPNEVLISTIILKRIFMHLFEVVLIFIVLFIVTGNIIGIVYYPFIFLLFITFVYGFSLLLASIVVYATDLDNVWSFAVKLIWIATPIFYSIGGQKNLFLINLFNPLYYYITLFRDMVIYLKMPELYILSGSIFFCILFLFLGLFSFKRLKTKFAELI